MPVVLPVIHLNGTSAERLCADLSDAYDALNDAYTALKQTAPNGRDYYVAVRGLMDQAEAQHHRRLRAIDDIMRELQEQIEGIQKQRRGA